MLIIIALFFIHLFVGIENIWTIEQHGVNRQIGGES